MPLTNIEEAGRDLVLADGQKFDFDGVLLQAFRVVRNLVLRAAVRFPGEAATYGSSVSQHEEPFKDDAYAKMAMAFHAIRHDHFDVCDFSWRLTVAGIRAHLLLHGMGPLMRRGDALASWTGEPAERLDLTPMILVTHPEGPHLGMDLERRKFLKNVLVPFERDGLSVTFVPEKPDAWTYSVYAGFPHAVFGAGEGRLRIAVRNGGEP